MSPQLNIRLPEHELEDLRAEALRTGEPVTQIVRKALRSRIGSQDSARSVDSGTRAKPERPATHSVVRFDCPIPDCGYKSVSSAAVCPVHGRRVR